MEEIMTTSSRSQIIIMGDGMSDIDGVGVKGYGNGRTFASVWTRTLKAYIDPRTSNTAYNPLASFTRFNVFGGGRKYGGTELAVSGQTTQDGKSALNQAITRAATPAMVVIAYTGVTDAGKITLAQAKKNLSDMVERALETGASILLIRFKKPNDTGHWDAGNPKNRSTIDFINKLNAYYDVLYKQHKNTGKVGLISDFYEPLRVKGVVPPSIVRNGLDVTANRADEYKLFDHVFRTMGPMLDPKYKPPKTDRNAIMVVGDHMSDIDGPARGYGNGRPQSVWTRELIKLVDGVKGGKDPNRFYVYDGGPTGGGSELAGSAASSSAQLQLLRQALKTTRPGVVIIATSHICEAGLAANQTFANVRELVALAQSVGAKVLLIGFPPADARYDEKTKRYARNIANGIKSIAQREQVSYVEDFYAPLRGSNGFVDTQRLSAHQFLRQSEATEQALFKNILTQLAPLLGMKPPPSGGGGSGDKPNPPPSGSKRTIMVVGDHYSDVDGPGSGFGDGRPYASIWTRELLANAASRDYKIIQGGNNRGGSELAAGGADSGKQKEFLSEALTRNAPGVVVLAGSYIHDWLKNNKTKSQAQMLAETVKNFADMVNAAKAKGAKVLIVGFKPGYQYTEKGLNGFANALHSRLKKLANDTKVGFVEDFYAPLRESGFVPTSRKADPDPSSNRRWELGYTPANQKKLFDNIWNGLAPLLGMKPTPPGEGSGNPKPPPSGSKRTIMVVGDHYSDVDGPGSGFGDGRPYASIWTRELLANAASRDYKIIQGGNNRGGSELAAGGADSGKQKEFLSEALTRNAPGVVVLAGSYIHDWLKNNKTKSQAQMLAETVKNFADMVNAAKAKGAKVLIVGFKPGYQYTEKGLNGFANALHSRLKKLANDTKVGFVEDFYAPLRESGFVPTSRKADPDPSSNRRWELGYTPANQKKLFDNIWNGLAPLLGMKPNPPGEGGSGDKPNPPPSGWYVTPKQTAVFDNLTSLTPVITPAPPSSNQPLSFNLGRASGKITFSGSSTVGKIGQIHNPDGSKFAGRFLVAAAGAVTFEFTTEQRFFSIRWGSLDLNNELEFYSGAKLILRVTGAQAFAARTGQSSNHSYDAGFSFSGSGFTRVVATARAGAPFEIGNIAVSKSPTGSKRTIMVVGDHYSDVDGPGNGFGGGRGHASIWTRELLANAASRDYKIIQGGNNRGGSELAAGGADSGKQKEFLSEALTRNAPGVVVLAGSYIHDWLNNNKTKSQAQMLAETVKNFADMVDAAKAKGAKVLIVGFKPGYRYTEKGLNDFANTLHSGLKKLANDKKVGFVEDFYAPLRESGFVPTGLKADPDPSSNRRWELGYTPANQKKLFDNIWNGLAPLLGMEPTPPGEGSGNPKPPPSGSKRTIMVVGDSISDLDGVGEPGYGKNGRSDAVWTRALAEQIDGPLSAQIAAYAPYRRFDVYEGGNTAGGRELAVSGTTSDDHLVRLRNELKKATPAIVILAVTNYNDIGKNVPLERTKSNIERMVQLARGVGAEVIIIGFPPAIESNAATDAIANVAREIAQRYKTGFVADYYKPLRGSNGYVSRSYFRDGIHLNDENRTTRERLLLKNIFDSALKAAMDRAAAKLDVPASFPGVSRFSGSSVTAGEAPVLTFELKGAIPQETKLPLKFWAKINDSDAGELNGSIVDAAKYVHFKEVFYRYSTSEQWKKAEYTTDQTTIRTKKGASTIYLKFETYKKAPFSFDLFVNFAGNPYSVRVVDLPKGSLYIRDQGDTSDRSVADVRQDIDSNTCYALAALQAAVSRAKGNSYIESLIRSDAEHYIVNFKNFGPIKIKKSEVETNTLWNADAAAAGQSGRELWVRVMELAYLRATKSDIQKDGSPLKPLEMFTGAKATEINGGKDGTQAIKKIIEGKGEHYIVVGTKQTLGSDLSSYRANHAYAITGMNADGTFSLWDPIGGKLVNISEADLRKISERFFVTNFDATGLNKGGDLNADGIPDAYARLTFLSEHKIKTPEADNRYYNWVSEDPNGKLINVEKFYQEYKKNFPDGGKGAEFNSTNYNDNIFKKYKKVKAGANDPNGFKKGANYFTIELWRRYVGADNIARFYRVYTRHYDVKSQVRLSQSTEITLGLEFRAYVDIENPTPDQAKRTRAGVVAGYTKNYEFMTTWAKNGHMTEGSPWRTRVRFSIAGEAIAYGSGNGGGLVAGIRLKGQVQVGRINNGNSWWLTFGIETSHALDFSNTEASLSEYIDAHVDGRTADAKRNLAAVLSKAAGANAYVGMNGLIQDGVKKLTERYADLVTKEKENENIQKEWLGLYGDDPESRQYHEEALKQLRRDRYYVARTIAYYGDTFHNFKWKVEFGVLWLPFVIGQPQGDGKYGGSGPSDSAVDRLHREIVGAMGWQEKIESVIKNGSVQQLRELLPATAVVIIDAINESSSFGNAITSAVLQADEQVAADASNGGYRALAAQLTAPMRSVLMGSIMATVTDQIMQRLLSGAKALAETGKSSFPIPSAGESAEAYGSRLGKHAASLVGGALKSVFTSRDAMLNMLLYGATLFTTEVIARFLDELDKRIFGDAPLTDADERQILGKAKTEEYKRFGISDAVARDLANGDTLTEIAGKYKLNGAEVAALSKRIDQASLAAAMREAAIDPNAALKLAKGVSFDTVAEDMGWNASQREVVRQQLDTVARTYGKGAISIADDAFRSGMNSDQRVAYDALKGVTGVPRETLRGVILNPKQYDSITENLSDDTKASLGERIEAARTEYSKNSTIGVLSDSAGSNWLSGLSSEQKAVARAMFDELDNAGEAQGREGRRKIARQFAEGGLKPNEVSKTASAVRDFTTSLTTAARLALPDALLVAVLAIPLFIALAKNDSNALRKAATALSTEAVFGAATVAVAAAFGGPAALAFGVLFIVSEVGGKYYEDQLKKNPWFMTTAKGTALAPLFGFKKISDGVTGFFKQLFGRSEGDRGIRFDPMSPKEVAYLAFAGVYKGVIAAGKTSEAASMALTFELIRRGVLSLDGLASGSNKNGDFDLNNAVFDLSKLTKTEWAQALAEYVHQRANIDGQKNRIAEIIAATLNAFNNMNAASGLGSMSGEQVRFWFRGQGAYLNETVDPRIPYFTSGEFRQHWQARFQDLFDKGVLGFSAGLLRFNFGESGGSAESFGQYFAESLRWASGSKDDWIDQKELAKAFDMVNAGETHKPGSARYERLRVAIRFYSRSLNPQHREFLTTTQLKQMIQDKHLRAVNSKTWIENGWKDARLFDLDIDWKGIALGNWGAPNDVIRELVIDAAMFGAGGRFSDALLGDALVRLGLLPMSAWGDDAKDVAKFLIRAVDVNVDLGAIDRNSILSTLIVQNVIGLSANGGPLTLNFQKLNPRQIAQSIKALSGSNDDVIGVEDLLRAFNYILPERRAFDMVEKGQWKYVGNYQPWFKKTADARADLNAWLGGKMGGNEATEGGRPKEWRFETLERLATAIEKQHFAELLSSRYKQASPEGLLPVVLDLTGQGLNFESLATSGALYDSNGDGTKELVAWAGRGTGILSYDINGDGVIERTNEIAFTSYKPGAKTDLEGLTAFDTNKNGLLDAGDTSWKKFGVWIDADRDGVSDAGEFRSLDDLRIASIGLVSDNVHRRLNGVTVHGLSTFVTTSGKRGTVGDVSFDVSRGGLSDAEIARRRDLLAQTVAGSGSSTSASTSLRAIGTDAALDLNLFGVKK
jgi:RNase H-fold protein (predicted Holliday junction resolvase)/LAS superfamily LD-carboxypeptidase LdcB